MIPSLLPEKENEKRKVVGTFNLPIHTILIRICELLFRKVLLIVE